MASFIKKNFWLLFLIGFLIRIILSGLSSWNKDVAVWYRLAMDLKDGFGAYGNLNFSYPPGLAAIFSLTLIPIVFLLPYANWGIYDSSITTMGGDTWLFDPIVTSPIFNFLFKVPIFVAEIFLVYLLYKYLKERTKKDEIAKMVVIFWYLNPLIIFINAIHGQLDIYPVIFLFLAVILFYLKKDFFSGVLFGISITMKMFPFIFLPFVLVFIFYRDWHDKTKRKILNAFQFFAGAIIFPISLFFLFSKGSFANILVFTRFDTIGFEGSLNFGFINYVPSLFNFIAKNESFLLNVQKYGLILGLILLFVWIISNINRAKDKFREFPLEVTFVLALFLLYFFSQRTNPNYIIWCLPFVLVLCAIEVIPYLAYWLLSLSGFIFYLGIYSLAYKLLFISSSKFFGWPSFQSLTLQYVKLRSLKGLINDTILEDIFLFAALLFYCTFVVIVIKLLNLIKKRSVKKMSY